MGISHSKAKQMIQIEHLKPPQAVNYPANENRKKVKVFDTIVDFFIIQKPEVAAGGYARFYVGCNRQGELYGFRELRLKPSKTQYKIYTNDDQRTVRHTTADFGMPNDVENMRLTDCLQSPFAAFIDPKRRKLYYAQALLHGTVKTVASIFATHLPEEDRSRLGLYFIREILTSICMVHKNGIMHLDVKPDNILYFNQKLYITDFGESDKVTQKSLCERGTQNYRAPEQVTKTINTQAADIWATAITVMELLGCHPFNSSGFSAVDYEKYRQGQAEPAVAIYFADLLGSFDVTLRQLLKAMTEADLNKRPTCSQILERFMAENETLLPTAFMQRIENAWAHVPVPEANIAERIAALKASCEALNLVYTQPKLACATTLVAESSSQ